MYFCKVCCMKSAKLRYMIFAIAIIVFLFSSTCHVCLKIFNYRYFSLTYLSHLEAPYLVDSSVCKILDVNPFDASIKHLLNLNPKPIDCDVNKVFTYVRNGILHVNSSTKPKLIQDCIVKPITKNGKFFIYGNISKRFITSMAVKDEFFKVECFNSDRKIVGENFHMQFVRKQNAKTNETNIDAGNPQRRTPPEHLMNVILIMLDSTSRINSLRYLPRTRNYLSETLGAVEMLGYNKVADNTRVNMVPFLTGEFENSLPCLWNKTGVDDCSFIWKNFSNAGYLTHFAEDWPYTGMFQYLMPGFKEQPTDYYDHPFHVANEQGEKGPCHHGKSSSDLLHDRVFDLASNIKTPYFSLSTHCLHTHDNLHGAANIDNSTMDLLSKLHRNNLLNNTFLAVFGDHGMRFGRVRESFIGQLEERLPMMFIYVPKWFRSKYSIQFKNLNRNARRLTTQFDMYFTLLNLLQLQDINQEEKSGKGISLFRQIPAERSCSDAHIEDHWCTCNYDKVSHDSTVLKQNLARALLGNINSYLKAKNVNHKCQLLKLEKVKLSVKVLSRGRWADEHKIIIVTSPGGAVFESTLIFNKISNQYRILGDISRLNKYENQSHCVKHSKLKKICICK